MVNIGDEVAVAAAAHGFALQEASELAEISGSAYVMRHEASGARLLYLRNEDANKAFSIGFKTPAADDTGVFHILEHSVLCGSDKFPVKEPFVNLLKSSMQTFLNAMTFPDKTMYPVASTNERDLLNLMGVYLDAVFHPLIYSKRTIFQQEGWHYELTEGSAQGSYGIGEQQLQINGVVYNEMKGALSEPDSVLYDSLSAALFPDTTYRFESGGTPTAIPTLTYESFLDTHRRHYVPSNSYIVLYGDMDIDRFLGFLNEGYLTPLAGVEASGHINELALQSPVVNMGVKKRMVTSPDNSCMALGYVVGTSVQRERIMATEVLLDAIMGSNESPMKRAILDAGIADDAHAYLSDGVAQPFAVIELKGLKRGAQERFAGIVEEQALSLSSGKLDRALVEASLSHAEFIMREHNLGYADGVVYAIASLSGWLYDDSCALEFLQYEDTFASLREKLDEGYFERLIADLFLNNDHAASVELIPVDADEEAREQHDLDALLASMSADEIEAIEEDTSKLRAAQMEPDSAEDLAKLPCLHVADIADAPIEAPFKECTARSVDDAVASLPLIYHEVDTHGISYSYRYFDLSCLAFEELPYVSVLVSVLGKLDTAEHSAAELDTLVHSKLGNLSFYFEVHESISGDEAIAPKLVISASALSENAADAAKLADEVVLTSDFHDTDKLRDILVQKRVAAEQMLTSAGHSVAMGRVSSYYSKAGVIREQLSGIDNYLFVKMLLEDFEEQKMGLADKLEELCRRIFLDSNCTLSFAGGDEALNAYTAALSSLHDNGMPSRPAHLLSIPEPVDKREAFAVPSDVTYSSIGAKRDGEYDGSWLVATRALSYDYLWNEVRVVGGAYGAGFQTTISGSSRFYSYRDPRIDETVDRFRSSGKWLSGFDPSEREFEGYIVSTVASMDAPVKPRDLVRRQDGMFFSGYTPAMRLRTRNQVLAASLPSVRKLGDKVSAISQADHVCVVGNRDIINASGIGLNVVELIRV